MIAYLLQASLILAALTTGYYVFSPFYSGDF